MTDAPAQGVAAVNVNALPLPITNTMDPSQLASELVKILVPFLLAGGAEMAKGAAGKVGENVVAQIWDKLRPKVQAKEAAREAVQDVISAPNDADAQTVLKKQFEKILVQDESLASELRPFVLQWQQNADMLIQGNARLDVKGDLVGRKIVEGDEYIAARDLYILQGASLAPRGDASLREFYLRRLAAACAELPFGILDPRFFEMSGARELTVKDIYIHLDVMAPAVREQEQTSFFKRIAKRMSGEENEPASPDRVPILDALAREDLKRVVLLGEMGSGKSTFAQYIAFALALIQQNVPNAAALLPQDSPLENLFPVRLVLREAARHIPLHAPKGDAQMLWNALRADLIERFGNEKDANAFLPELRAHLRNQPTMILFDGLDEVPEADERRAHLLQALADFTTGLPDATRVVVTARPYAYEDKSWRLARFETLTLAPFNDEQTERFIENWYQAVRRAMQWDEQTAQNKALELRDALRDRDDLADIASRPLLLTLMATLSSSGGTLPNDRFDLYDKMVGLLLSRWDKARFEQNDPGITRALKVDEVKIRKTLAQLAFDVHARQRSEPSRRDEPADISEREVLNAFDSIVPDDVHTRVVLRYLNTRAGLLSSRKPNVYAFPHRSFQEFLAAEHLSQRVQAASALRALVMEDARWWREVALWQAGIGGNIIDHMIALVNQFVPASHTEMDFSDAHYRTAVLAGMILHQAREKPLREPAYAAPYQRVVHALAHLVQESKLDARERAEAGNVLGQLGDPRSGVGRIPVIGDTREILEILDLVFCEIPPDDFIMGDTLDDWGGKKEITYTKIKQPYYITRYPITNAQFDAFLQARDGFQNPVWWKGLARTDNQSFPPKQGAVYDLPNHPVVNVTWYQAVAFTHWLNEKLKAKNQKLKVWRNNSIETFSFELLTCRLPSEAEWEKAARTHDGRKYPWGPDVTPEHANYSDTKINATSAVGCFPKGTNDYGVLDMSGNVWEWCETKWVGDYSDYVHQEDNSLQGDSRRVVRGGAFFSNVGNVRCACRNCDYPRYFGWGQGFRVVLSPA